jgi:hypothetical protein
VAEGASRPTRWPPWIKASLVALAVIIVAPVVAVLAIVTDHSTDCFADFQSKRNAGRVLTAAHVVGLTDTDLVEHRNSASIRVSSGETGDDARSFRRTVRTLVSAGGGRMERNTPCVERPYFD